MTRSLHTAMLTCAITIPVTHRIHTHMIHMQRRITPTTSITMEAIHRHTKFPLDILTVPLQRQVIGLLRRDTRHFRPLLAMHLHQAMAILHHRAMVHHLQVTCLLATHRPVIHIPRIHRLQVVATCQHPSTLVTLRIRHPMLATNNNKLSLATAIHRLLNAASHRARQTTGATDRGENASVDARHLQGQVVAMEADEAHDGNTATGERLGNCRPQNFAAVAAGCCVLVVAVVAVFRT